MNLSHLLELFVDSLLERAHYQSLVLRRDSGVNLYLRSELEVRVLFSQHQEIIVNDGRLVQSQIIIVVNSFPRNYNLFVFEEELLYL